MKRRTRMILEYLSAFLLITVLLLAIAGVVVVKFYGNDLQAFVMDQVNNRLESNVDVENIAVQVFHKFPNTSIQLSNVTIWSSHNFNSLHFQGYGADTLLSAEAVSITFNIFGLIRKKFNIRQLEVKNGVLHLYTDLSGNGNYRIVSHQTKKKGNDPLVNLSSLRISDFQIIINNQAKQLISTSTLNRLDLNGRFSKSRTQLRGSLTGYMKEISNKGILYASNRNIKAKLNLSVQDSLYTIKSGQLQIDRILADMDGRFLVRPGEGVELDLYADARDLEIYEVLDLLPRQMSNPLQEIHGNGKLQLYTRIIGMLSSTLTPKIEAEFQTSNANLQWDRFPFSVRNLNLIGSYSNGGQFNPVTTSLNIESLSAVVGQDHLSGRGRINNFFDPDFSIYLKGDIHPEQWIGWYESIPLHKVTGTLISDIKITGSYDRLKPRGEKFVTFDVAGGISLENIMVMIRKGGLSFSNVNGSVAIDNDFWKPSLKGSYGKSDFNISGSGLNLISFLLGEDETLVATANFRSNRFDLQEVLDSSSDRNKKGSTAISFPENIDLKMDFVVDEFLKDPFKASNVRGIATYDSPSLYIDSLSMQSMNGTLLGTFGLLQYQNGMITTSANTSFYDLEIKELFKSFKNFGQTQITSQHLKGTVSGTSVFSADFDSTMKILTESILSENNLTIRNGELNEFSPLLALSRFIQVEELRNIKFETLENNILIKDQKVIIPAMEIKSNALNLSASGTHGFDNKYDYRLKLNLSEILYNKARNSKRGEFQEAADESDTRTVFLKIINDGTETTVEVDREKTAQKIRNDLKQEKSELKKILNEELGLFGRDEELKDEQIQLKDNQETFKFDFSEDPDTISTAPIEKEKNRWKKKWVKKDTLQNKPATKFVIDE